MKKLAGWWCLGGMMAGIWLILACLGCQPTHYPSLPPPPPPKPPVAEPPPPERPTLFVGVGRLNLRAGPGLDFPIVIPLERNEEVEKLGETADWFQVRVKRTGAMGWVASKFLSAKPTTAPPAAPAPPTVVQPPAPEPAPEPAPAAPAAKPPEKPKPARPTETVTPRAPKPAEAKEPPPAKKPAEKPAEEKRPPAKEEPPAKPSEPPPEKPSGIRLM